MDEQSQIASDAAEQTANAFLDEMGRLESKLKQVKALLKKRVDYTKILKELEGEL